MVLGACSSPTPDGPGSSAASPQLTGTLTVLAAASLTESFTAIGAAYEKAHPGVKVALSFSASSTIVQQVNGGAPAQLIALAGQDAAKPLKPELSKGSTDIAVNVLEIAVPPANPGKVTALSDLSRPDLKVVVCAPQVPCGAAGDAMLKQAGITPNIVSREADVKATLTKVRLGEADAGIVYHSDIATSKGSVVGVAVPTEVNQRLTYPLIRLDDSALARDFAVYVGTAGRDALAAAGFQAP